MDPDVQDWDNEDSEIPPLFPLEKSKARVVPKISFADKVKVNLSRVA